MRNTRVIDIYHELKSFDMDVDVYDLWADPKEVMHEYGIEIINGGKQPEMEQYAIVILAVAHQEFKTWELKKFDHQVVYDVKSILPKDHVDSRL